MTVHVEYMHVLHVEVGGTARPGTVELGGGEANTVAALTLDDTGNGIRVVIEGRPIDLLSMASSLKHTAEQILELTKVDPELRALYGVTE